MKRSANGGMRGRAFASLSFGRHLSTGHRFQVASPNGVCVQISTLACARPDTLCVAPVVFHWKQDARQSREAGLMLADGL